MPNITKPNDLNNVWAATGDIVAPAADYIANGWEAIIPPREYFNWLDNRQDRFNAHVNQHGVPVWDASTEYQAGLSYTKGSDGNLYRAITTNSNINPVGDSTGAWININDTGLIILTTTGVFNVPAILKSGAKKAKITVTGAGGSGGTGVTFYRGGAGGAGGTTQRVMDLFNLSTINYTIGVGGARRTLGGLDGLAGSSSSFLTLTAAGGGAGTKFVSGGFASGGLGGTSSGGVLNLKGGDGSDGSYDGNGAGGSGDGGASFWGGGIRGATSTSGGATVNPTYGSGGGGGTGISGPGANGVIVIEWQPQQPKQAYYKDALPLSGQVSTNFWRVYENKSERC